MSERVTVTRHEHQVVEVRLSSPERRNGLDRAMFDALIEAGEWLVDDTSARAVVLSGAGPAFCAGLDLRSVMGDPDAVASLLHRDPAVSPANRAQRVAWVWQEVPVPVIAAVHGVAFGGGLQIALGADLRYVSPDARLAVKELQVGLIPDMGITRTLTRLVGLDVAKELTWTGREVSGEEAVRLGLATRVCADPRAEALETARLLASRSPDAVRAAKRLFDQADGLDVAGALALETLLQLPLLGSANQMEAVAAWISRREPTFTDPE